MQASSTTLNISSPVGAAVEEKPKIVLARGEKHSHGPNFGRYVEGCRVCMHKYPDGAGSVPVNKQRKRNDTTVGRLANATEALGATSEIAAKIAKDNADTIAALMDQIDKLKSGEITPAGAQAKGIDELVKLMLRKESRTIEKEEIELQRQQEGREQMLKSEQERIAQQERMQSNCSHTKENGITAICQQQIHNDGMVHPFCQRCFKTWPARLPNRQ